MIIETLNNINIKDLSEVDFTKDREYQLRKDIYDFCTSAETAERLIDGWISMSAGYQKVISAANYVLLFPEKKEKLNLTHWELDIIKNPPKRYFATSNQPQTDTFDYLPLLAAGKVLFPETFHEQSLDIEKSIVKLDGRLDRLKVDPYDERYQNVYVISEKILHKELYPDGPNNKKYPIDLWNQIENAYLHDDESKSNRHNFLPGILKLLFPEKYKTYTLPQQSLIEIEIATKGTQSIMDPLSVFLAKAIVADDVFIDEKGAHFTPPTRIGEFTQIKNIPKLRRF
jgi:hypothetical protein